jgi:hypothetical protein
MLVQCYRRPVINQLTKLLPEFFVKSIHPVQGELERISNDGPPRGSGWQRMGSLGMTTVDDMNCEAEAERRDAKHDSVKGAHGNNGVTFFIHP